MPGTDGEQHIVELIMRWSHYAGIMALLICLAGTPAISGAEDVYQPLKQFSRVMDLIENTYVRDVDRQELIEGAIQGMLHNLDPHSAFLDKQAYEDMQVETSGEFSGVGIEITLQNGRLTVVSPIEDTPAFEAGLKAGDIILEINGENTQDISIMDAVHKIRGPKGTEVELTVLHKGENAPEKIVVKRDVIPMHSVKTEELESGYHYLRITNFNENTTQELHKVLRQQGTDLKGVVLDLRNNPGGLLHQAVSVADTFLRDGKIVYTKGKVEQAQMSFSAKKQQHDTRVPVVVMINAGTASASEIVAGALQDQKRGLIIGEKSFGKGSVQTIIPLEDQSAIKLTTARYYTPSGRSIQAEGIRPDIRIPFDATQDSDDDAIQIPSFREQDLEGHLENGKAKNATKAEEVNQKVQIMLQKDNQLRLALQLVKSLPAIKALK